MNLIRMEHALSEDGMWTTKFDGHLVLESLSDDRLLNLPMPYDPTHQTNGLNWKTAVQNAQEMMHWFTKKDLEEMASQGFQVLSFSCEDIIKQEFQTLYVHDNRKNVVDITESLILQFGD